MTNEHLEVAANPEICSSHRMGDKKSLILLRTLLLAPQIDVKVVNYFPDRFNVLRENRVKNFSNT